MIHIDQRTMAGRLRSAVLAIAILATAACSSREKPADTASPSVGAPPPSSTGTSPAGSPMSSSDTMAGTRASAGMPGMAMTGDADHDFLRMMSDHHQGMILMAHMTKEGKQGGPAIADAERIDTKQDAELDTMMTMLEKHYKDPYTPKVTPDNQAMADALKGKTGADYERAFYQNVIKHHEQAVKMVDDYLPRLKNPTVRRMAELMKADQTKEIAEFQKKIGQIK